MAGDRPEADRRRPGVRSIIPLLWNRYDETGGAQGVPAAVRRDRAGRRAGPGAGTGVDAGARRGQLAVADGRTPDFPDTETMAGIATAMLGWPCRVGRFLRPCRPPLTSAAWQPRTGYSSPDWPGSRCSDRTASRSAGCRDIVAGLRADRQPPQGAGHRDRGADPTADLRADAAGHVASSRTPSRWPPAGSTCAGSASAPTRCWWSAQLLDARVTADRADRGAGRGRGGQRRRHRRGHGADPDPGLAGHQAGRAGTQPAAGPARPGAACWPGRTCTVSACPN